ncbi:MAG TPA: non-canonical purine NTP pyrophosphatase [Candidatus Paceibacterota bacterium]|nr:non-canonical purine NTP pyrophosphatase [Candidatus Paceibacterota bacterium]
MNLILSTRNPSKALQIKALFDGSPLSVRTLADAGIEGEAVEDGATLEENAAKKAWYAHEKSDKKSWTMADDTGIFIDALGGEPGVYSARWAGDVSTEEITRYTLQRLEDATDRSATFRTVVVAVSPEGIEYTFAGEVRGTILTAPRVPPQPKMPYSPLFVPHGQDKVWAEMTTKEENAISHRGIAFRKARAFLEGLNR